MIKHTQDLHFDTRASIIAFCDAEADRMDYLAGCAEEMHIPEPYGDDEPTLRYSRTSLGLT